MQQWPNTSPPSPPSLPLHRCSILLCWTHEPPAHPGVSQTPHNASSLQELAIMLKHLLVTLSTDKNLPWIFFTRVYVLKCSQNDITLLQCCTVRERCQSPPLIPRICPVATWLCSVPDIMAWQHVFIYIGLLLRRWTPPWGVEAHSQRLPVLWDTAKFPASSRSEKSTALLLLEEPTDQSCMKTNCSHG